MVQTTHHHRFVWPRLATPLAAWCRDCQHCQWAKVTKQPMAAPQSIANPHQRFSHLHINLAGPLPPSSSGHTHLPTVLDHQLGRGAALFDFGGQMRGHPGRWHGSEFRNKIPQTGAARSAPLCGTPSLGGWLSRRA
jgi:hypothetical protein